MLGSIIGDIAGSYLEVLEIESLKTLEKKRSYEERIKILDENTPLFDKNSSCTDDSNLTCAIADAVINNKNYETTLKEYALKDLENGLDKYGRSRYGKGFVSWLMGKSDGKSFGNGSAMRIAPIGFLFDDIDTIKEQVRLATIPSHNNVEAIKCAESVAITIYLARNKFSKEEIKKYIEGNYFKLDYNLVDLQKNYKFSSRCSESVPQALYCFLISNDFIDAIRKSLSIGGDCDTIACITGGISEAFYGIPEDIKTEVQDYIPEYMKDILIKFYSKMTIKKLKKIL